MDLHLDTFLTSWMPPMPFRVPGVPPCQFKRGQLGTTFNYARENGDSPPMVLMFSTPIYFIETFVLDDFNGNLHQMSIAETQVLDRGDKGFNMYYTFLPQMYLMKLLKLLSKYSYMFGEWELAPTMYTVIG